MFDGVGAPNSISEFVVIASAHHLNEDWYTGVGLEPVHVDSESVDDFSVLETSNAIGNGRAREAYNLVDTAKRTLSVHA